MNRSYLKTLSVLILIMLVGVEKLSAQQGSTFGKDKFDRGIYTHATSDGNILSVGYTQSYSQQGDEDYFLVKTSKQGETRWEKVLGGTKLDIAFGFTELPNHGGYLVIGFSRSFGTDEDILVYKVSESGEVIWQKNYQKANNERCWSIKALQDGNYMIVGQTQDRTTKIMYGMMTKIDADGNMLWQKTYGDEIYNRIYYCVENKDRELFVAGLVRSDTLGDNKGWILKIDKDGQQLASNKLTATKNTTPHGIMLTSRKDEILVVGYAQVDTAKDQRSFYMAWLDKNGKVKREKTQYEPGIVNHGLSGVLLKNGDFIMTGYTRPLTDRIWDGLICKFDKDGKLIWRKSYGADKSDQFYTIAESKRGKFVITGHTSSYGAGNADFWLLRIDGKGELLN